MPANRGRITRTEYESLAELRHAMRRFLRFSEEAALALGIEPVQHQALLAIKGSRAAVSVGELAERLCIRQHSAVGLVNRLRARGFLRRTKDTLDRRRVHLELTVRGEALLARLSLAHRDELRRLGPYLEGLLRSLGTGGGARSSARSHRRRGERRQPA